MSLINRCVIGNKKNETNSFFNDWDKVIKNIKTEKNGPQIYVIYDAEDKEEFFRGTEQQCKDWWWELFLSKNDIASYKINTKENFDNESLYSSNNK